MGVARVVATTRAIIRIQIEGWRVKQFPIAAIVHSDSRQKLR